MRCLATALLLGMTSILSAAEFPAKPQLSPIEKKLVDKWIVREVQLDGKPTPAQIGQKKGDIITIHAKDHKFFLR